MSLHDLMEAVQDVETPDFCILNNAGVFHIRALTTDGLNFLLENVSGIADAELVGGIRLDRVSAVEVIDGIFDAGLSCV